MHAKKKNLDDILYEVYTKLLRKKHIVDTSRGLTSEINGVMLELLNPRARLSRTEIKGTIFSCIGELLWYLSGSNKLDAIQHYIPRYKKDSDDGVTIYGGYGPRLSNMRGKIPQIENIIQLLQTKPNTRRAVIQLFDAEDLTAPHKDIPCTCTMQFLIRASQLEMITYMRSNDAFLGLPHDVFVFTMLQEIIARRLNVELGSYKHFVGSLHLYEINFDSAQQYINEGWQSNIPMPSMPKADPSYSIKKILVLEEKIRNGENIDLSTFALPDYWKDIAILLIIFRTKKQESILDLAKEMSSDIFKPYIVKRHDKSKKSSSQQLDLKFPNSK